MGVLSEESSWLINQQPKHEPNELRIVIIMDT